MFEEAKRKQRHWAIHQDHIHRQSLIQQKQGQEQDYYYQQSDINDNGIGPTFSNTDVSSMNLYENTATSPSIVASTNIVDPSLMNEDIQSTSISPSQPPPLPLPTVASGGLHYQPSATSVVTNTSANSDYNNRRPIMSPTPSQQSEHSNSVMDREQIRRHLAPGQAIISNRQIESPQPIHHRSKEYITRNEPTPLAALSDDRIESNISTEVDFPHDSDRFSIRSETTTPKTPQLTQQPSASSKTSNNKNRSSMKKMIWG
jgi:hypothetical protein